MRYAINAMNLLGMQRHGMQPEGPVMVEMGRDARTKAPRSTSSPTLTERMDWRMLVNLQVAVEPRSSDSLDRLLRAVRDIAASRQLTCCCALLNTGSIEVGSGYAPPGRAEPFLPTFVYLVPISLTGSAVGAGLRRCVSQAGSTGGHLAEASSPTASTSSSTPRTIRTGERESATRVRLRGCGDRPAARQQLPHRRFLLASTRWPATSTSRPGEVTLWSRGQQTQERQRSCRG